MIIDQITAKLNSIASIIVFLKKEHKNMSYIVNQFKSILKQNGSTDEDIKDFNILNTLTIKLQKASEGDPDAIIQKYLDGEIAVNYTLKQNHYYPSSSLSNSRIKTLTYDGQFFNVNEFGNGAIIDTVNFPNVESLGTAFLTRAQVNHINMPNLKQANGILSWTATAPETLYFPNLHTINYSGFYYNTSTKYIILPKITTMYTSSLYGDNNIELVYFGDNIKTVQHIAEARLNANNERNAYIVLTSSQPPNLDNKTKAYDDNESSLKKTTYFVVPDNAVDTYKTDNRWTLLKKYIIGHSELPDKYNDILKQYNLGVK